jgi:hypothetical protein
MHLDIDEELYERLAARAAEMGFDSPEEYSITVLRTVVDELQQADSEDDVRARLSDLGYLE